ncbi:MAG: DNA-binding protein [Gemmatimonadaceae bacterium]
MGRARKHAKVVENGQSDEPDPSGIRVLAVPGQPTDLRVIAGSLVREFMPPSRQSATKRMFFERSMRALLELVDTASEKVVEEALKSRTGAGGIARFVADAIPLSAGLADADPLAASFARVAEKKQALLKRAGGVFGATQVARLLDGISRQAVEKRRAAQQLLAVRSASGDYQYPACQFTPDGVVSHLGEFLRASRFRDPWMQLQLLLSTPETLAGQRVIEALASPDAQVHTEAIRVAQSAGELGA